MSPKNNDRDSFAPLLSVAEAVLVQARKAGAEEAEVFVRRSRGRSLRLREGVFEEVHEHRRFGLGLRVRRGGRLGMAWTTLEDAASEAERSAALERAAQRACASALWTEPEPAAWSFAQDDLGCAPFGAEAFDAVAGGDLQARVALLRESHDAAFAIEPRLAYADLHYGEEAAESLLLTSVGGFAARRGGRVGLGCEAVLRDPATGEQQAGYDSVWGHGLRFFDPLAAVRSALERAAAKFGAGSYPTGRPMLLFSPECTAEFLEALEPAFSAREVRRGRSLFAERLGAEVAALCWTLRLEPFDEDGPHPCAFDDEGSPARPLALIRRGRLEGLLYDRREAAYFGARPTGSAFRASAGSLPQIGFSQVRLEPGSDDPRALMRRMGEGLWVRELLGTHTMDRVSGEFSFGAVGLAVRGGEPAEPVAGVAVSGNVFDLLRRSIAAGSDLRWFASGVAAPSLLVEGLSVGGRGA